MLAESVVAIHRRDFDVAIFDLDGVLTDTARAQAAAWKTVFDVFLPERAERQGVSFEPFDGVADYRAHVDGRLRYDGVRNFLAARGIKLPEGSESDPPDAETVRALGERKAVLFRQGLRHGIDPEEGAEALLDKLRQTGILRRNMARTVSACLMTWDRYKFNG
jgi:beta-phosphoglucomutase-like phosphatase (HAD superfamily)